MFSLRVQPTIKSQTQTSACTDAVIYALSKQKEENKKIKIQHNGHWSKAVR